jgi:hypothetical protein
LAEFGETVPGLRRELASPAIVSGVSGQVLSYRANAEHPFPFEQLLQPSGRREAVGRILVSTASPHRRLRIAARWHAKAHWAAGVEDAVLALGIAFDAMLTEQGPSPGRSLAERYALLVPDPEQRRKRYREFQSEFYSARSSVAHGAKKTTVDYRFVRRLAREVRWTFGRILELSEAHGVQSEDDYESFFADLKWGET